MSAALNRMEFNCKLLPCWRATGGSERSLKPGIFYNHVGSNKPNLKNSTVNLTRMIIKIRMRLFAIITFLISLTACSYSQSSESIAHISGDIKQDLNNLLPEGKVTVDIMDGVKQNKRQEELTKKFQEGIKSKYSWFVEFMKTIPQGEPMPYHPNLNLTKEEYIELQGYMNDIELVSSGKADLIIKKKGNIIEFTGSGKLEVFNSVKINLKNNTVKFDDKELAFSDSLNVTTDKNGLKSKWKGYSWRFEEPKDLDVEALNDLPNLNAKQYKLTIGQLEKNGKIYLSIKGREFEYGAQTINFEIPVLF